MDLNKEVISKDIWVSSAELHVDGLHQDIGRTLVLAPHPDDEALGCGGLIALLRSQNTEVHVVFVTNGGASHPNSVTYDRNKLQALRKSEAMSSCIVLGVTTESIHFVGLEDSKLDSSSSQQKQIFNNKLKEVFEICSFDSIVTTWRKDAHHDHRETYKFCKSFIEELNQPIQFIEYPIWLWKNGKPEDWPTFQEVEPYRLEIKSVLEIKNKAIAEHVSQTTRLIDDDPDGFILTEDLLAPFQTDYEYYVFTLLEKNSSLDKTYFGRLYTNSDDPWDFKNSAYERKKYLKTLEYLKYYRFENALEIGCSIGEHSNLLSRHCDNLTAIDISPKAIQTAISKFDGNGIDFKVWNVSQGLPKGGYDLITLCEVGYYLNKEDLIQLYEDVNRHLNEEGMVLLVHWMPYVREYPLTGRQVHHTFQMQDFVQSNYQIKSSFRHKYYELILWQKIKK